MSRAVRWLGWALAAALLPAAAGAARPAPKEYDLVTLAPGVHGLVWREPLGDPIEGNSLIVVNDEDVLVVDATLLPSTARRLAEEVRRLTPKPVRYVVNTHWHDDHQMGNQVFRELWPGVQFVAHRHTRTDALERSHQVLPGVLAGYRESIERYRGWLERGVDDAGKGFDEGRRQRAEAFVGLLELVVDELGTVRPTLPDLTFDDALVLHRGSRTIELRWLGRGNTRGDVVVFLPRERIVATGDLVVHPSPFGIGSYYGEWVDTLEALAGLEAEILFPGHGAVQRDLGYLRQLQALLRDLVAEVGAAVDAGATLEETQARVTLNEWKERFSAGDADVAQAFDAFFVQPAVERAWRQARGEPDTVDRLE